MKEFIKLNWFKIGLLVLTLVVCIYWDNTRNKNLDCRTIPVNSTISEKKPTEKELLINSERYIINNDNTITDKQTGLIWEDDYTDKFSPPLLQYDNAVNFCKKLSLAHSNSWRLPTLTELQSVFDSSKFNPSTTLPDMENNLYWSSTLSKDSHYKQYPFIAIVSFFNNGYFEAPTPTTAFNLTRCVR